MPTYIMLSSLSPDGVQTIKNNPQRIREVNKEVAALGGTVKAQWAVLGRYDFINVVEAPDEQTIAWRERLTKRERFYLLDPDARTLLE